MSNNFPTIKPSLNLQFANTGALPPDVTFTRASSSGGYYDGKTVAKAEENLLLRSQEFDNAYWQTASNVTITANSIAAPDGTTTAETMTEVATTATHRVSANNNLGIAGLADQTVTLSCFIKAGTRDFGKLSITNITGLNQCSAWFDVGTGAVGTVLNIGNGSGATASISAAADGWYRCVLTGKADTSSGAVFAFIAIADADNSSSYLGDVTKDIYIWGAQLEQRSSVTAYTPTTTQPITNYVPKLLFAPANVPVFDHNPTTGEALGLSVWEARTNLLLRSEEFDNAYWTKSNATVSANQIIAPDGTLTADKLVENNATATHFVGRVISLSDSTTHTHSFYAKKAERSWVISTLIRKDASGRVAYFDLENGVVGTVSSGDTASITHVGNGWYRCTLSANVLTGATTPQYRIGAAAGDGEASYAGDETSGIFIWGAQLEAGAFATPYIPTVGSTVARSADVAVMTGANFSRWYRADEGTFVVEHNYNGGSDVLGGNRVAVSVSDGTTGNRVYIYNVSSTTGGILVTTAGSTQAALAGAAATSAFVRSGLSYSVNEVSLSVNGSALSSDTSAIIPIVDRANIGSGVGGGQILSGYIKSVSYYPRALPSSLVALTQ